MIDGGAGSLVQWITSLSCINGPKGLRTLSVSAVYKAMNDDCKVTTKLGYPTILS